MSSDRYSFLFAYPDSKKTLSSRRVHLRRLYDILEISIHRNDLSRARRAWAILVRCKETNWRALWKTGTMLVAIEDDTPESAVGNRVEFLTTMMLQYPDARESIIQEMILHLISTRQYRRALDELELYLPSPPFQENSVLHLYAGLICLYVAQPQVKADIPSGARSLRDAQQYFDRSKYLNQDSMVATAWSDATPKFVVQEDDRETPVSDDENMTAEPDIDQRGKRARI